MIQYPDVIGAIFSRLRANSAISTLTEGRIRDEVKEDWAFSTGKGKPAIVVAGPRGGPGVVAYPLCAWRVDLFTYGEDRRLANDLMAKVLGWLCPQDVTTTGGNAFTAAGVRIMSIEPETGPNTLIDPDLRIPYCTVPIIVRFNGVPVS